MNQIESPPIPGLHQEQEISWDRIFSDWCVRETGEDWGWESVWQEHGFDNWADWRMTYVERFGLLDRAWNLYHIEQPLDFVPNMYVGAYKGWQQYGPDGQGKVRFAELQHIEDNLKVMKILQNFPKQTTMIGIKFGETYCVFEGTHRAAAIALAVRQGQSIDTKIQIALTEFRSGEQVLFDANCLRRAN